MKPVVLALIASVSAFVVGAVAPVVGLQAPGAGARGLAQPPPPTPSLVLTIPAWPDGDDIPVRFTQSAAMPVSPLIQWSNAPEGTRSFVLHFHDPDAALNRTTTDQVHWLVWNIPGSATGLPENVPPGAQLPDGSRQTSASGPIYRGPGARATGPRHHYTFELYALDTMLDVMHGANEQETRTAVLRAMDGHVLGKAVYVGLFRRPL
jgi:Raf kinase inhibitor-like YbhB/YbcL family protein